MVAIPRARQTVLDRLLRPLSNVRPGEGLLAVLMLVCVLLILTSYYLMKTAREGLILTGGTFGLRGSELKTYANGAMALALIAVVPAYGALASRVRRIRLINISYAIVVVCLIGFHVLARIGAPIGLAFFVWLGMVSVFLIAQFWSYANDLYTEDQGKRLFAIIAIGGSVGAVLGPRLAQLADTFTLMLMAGGLLVAALVLFNVIEHVEGRQLSGEEVARAPITGSGGFALVLRDRYLLLIAALLLVANLVNTTGEYILSNAAANHAAELVPATAHADLVGAARDHAITADRREIIKVFYGDFFFWVNLVGFLIQAFLVSRVIEKLGVRRALFALPVIAFGAYAAIGTIGGLALIRAAKVLENGTDYSMQNTVRQALFLPTARVVKYKAKAAIDTFFVRAGDTVSAVLVGFGIHELGFGGRQIAFANLAMVALWLAIAAAIARRHRLLSAEALLRDCPPSHAQAGAQVFGRVGAASVTCSR